MRSELATKIDEVLEFLEPNWIAYENARIHGEANPVEPSISREELESLRKKALHIYVLAHSSGLANELPPEPKVDYETKLKLIGSLKGDRFYYTPKAVWFDALRAVARMAESSGGLKSDGKPGRKSTKKEDAKTYDEYHRGLEDRKWGMQTEYLREKYPSRWAKNPSAAKSWLSMLLKRVEERQNS